MPNLPSLAPRPARLDSTRQDKGRGRGVYPLVLYIVCVVTAYTQDMLPVNSILLCSGMPVPCSQTVLSVPAVHTGEIIKTAQDAQGASGLESWTLQCFIIPISLLPSHPPQLHPLYRWSTVNWEGRG